MDVVIPSLFDSHPLLSLSFKMVFVTPFVTLVSLYTLSTLASGVTVQKADLQTPADAAQNLQTVKEMFSYSYNAYKSVITHGVAAAYLLTAINRSYAWGHDSLAPLTKNFTDSRNGWGATIVDSLSTMVRESFLHLGRTIVNWFFLKNIMGLDVRTESRRTVCGTLN